jgi:hypothetical protein
MGLVWCFSVCAVSDMEHRSVISSGIWNIHDVCDLDICPNVRPYLTVDGKIRCDMLVSQMRHPGGSWNFVMLLSNWVYQRLWASKTAIAWWFAHLLKVILRLLLSYEMYYLECLPRLLMKIDTDHLKKKELTAVNMSLLWHALFSWLAGGMPTTKLQYRLAGLFSTSWWVTLWKIYRWWQCHT